MKYISPLRYPGGKLKLQDFLSDVISQNGPINVYVEPFAGGAGAALGLLVNEVVSQIFLNDSDLLIYNLWNSILNETDKFIELIINTPINIEEWNNQRKKITNENTLESLSSLETGFAAFYLNRCNRSGILRPEIGPIGGKSQDGEWKINARFNKKNLIKRIKKISTYKNRIKFSNFDAISFMKSLSTIENLELSKVIIYLDPPYYENGPKLYRSSFSDDDHKRLQIFLENELSIKWVLSYDDVPFINKLYERSKKNGLIVNHFANQAKIGKELIILSDNCVYQGDIFSKDMERN